MKKSRLLLLAISAMTFLSQGSALAGVVTTDQYKFEFNGVLTSTIPSPAITATTATTTTASMFGVGNGSAGLNASANILFGGAGSGNRGSALSNLNGAVALSTTKKEVLEFDWTPATTDGDGMAYNAIGISDNSKNPIFVLVSELWTTTNSGLHLMNLQKDSLNTTWMLKTAKYSGTSDFKTDCNNIYAPSRLSSRIPNAFPNGKTYHVKAKLDFATHIIDSIFITRSDSANLQYVGANIAFLSASATNVDKISSVGTRGRNQTNAGNGVNAMVSQIIDNFSVYTWEVAATTSVTVNYYDADNTSTLITSIVRANQAIGATYTATGFDKASFVYGGFNCVYSSTSLDNVTLAADGTSHVDLFMKKYPTTSGSYTWTGLTDGTWNELNANFSTDGMNSLGYQVGNGLIFPEIASNKIVTVNDNFSLGANDLTVSGDGYTISGSSTLSGTGKLNIALGEFQTLTLGVTNNLTGTTQISGGSITLSKAGVLGAGINTTGVSTLTTAANAIAIPVATFGASATINSGTNTSTSIAGMSAASGVKISVANGYNHANVGTTGFDFAANGTLAAGSELELNGTGTDNRIGMTSASTTYLANAKLTLKGNAMFYINTNQAAATTINVGTLAGETGAKLGWGKSSALDRTITWSVGALNESSEYAGSITNLGGYNASGSSFVGTYTNFVKVGTGVLTMSGNTNLHNGTFTISGGQLKVTGALGKSTTPITMSGISTLAAQDTGKVVASTLAMGMGDTLLISPVGKVTVNTAAGSNLKNVVITLSADSCGVLSLPDGLASGDSLFIKVAGVLTDSTYHVIQSANLAGVTFGYVSLPSDRYTYNAATGVVKYLDFTSAIQPAVRPSFSVYTVDRNLMVSGVEGYDVYNVQGAKIASVKVNTAATKIALQPGVYVVKAAGKVQKVLVK